MARADPLTEGEQGECEEREEGRGEIDQGATSKQMFFSSIWIRRQRGDAFNSIEGGADTQRVGLMKVNRSQLLG